MNLFFPEIEENFNFRLKVSDIHELYVEESGNPAGFPVIFLHGGPGGGCSADHRRFFDPKKFRVILFDQRGCGRSTPHAELKENTTWDLVEDIEKIRSHFNISKWLVFGGSWGSTLALSYAITHPHRVENLVLRGVFLCRPHELKWFYQEGASEIFPDLFQPYHDFIPPEERHDFISAYHKRLTSPDGSLRLQAAKIWSQWEAGTSYLLPKLSAIEEYEDPAKAIAFARIEAHYFINKAFFKTDNFLLENASQIQKIPGTIVQGRYDVVCPARSAWELHRAWPISRLNIVPDSGHAASEAGIRSALIETLNQFVKNI